jgi:NADPH:quinone reductase
MKAFALESSGKPAALMTVPKPEVGEADILVAVRAASVNGFDVYQASGYLFGMMEHSFPAVVGRDFSGVVEGVGPGVREFATGDEVFGFIPSMPPLKSGAFAEYVAGGRELVLAPKPAGLDSTMRLLCRSPVPPRSTSSRRSMATRAIWPSGSHRSRRCSTAPTG